MRDDLAIEEYLRDFIGSWGGDGVAWFGVGAGRYAGPIGGDGEETEPAVLCGRHAAEFDF